MRERPAGAASGSACGGSPALGESSALGESAQVTTGRVPAMSYLDHGAGSARPLQAPEHAFAIGPVALGHHLDPPVQKILGESDQAELQSGRAHPPAEADSLNTAAYPGREPHLPGSTVPARAVLARAVLARAVLARVGSVWAVRGRTRRIAAGHQRPLLGRGWHLGQLYDDRFMNFSRRTGVPHRGHGSPTRP